MKSLVCSVIDEMLTSGELTGIRAGGVGHLALPASLELLSQTLSRSKVKLLSPFDNLVIQRKRLQTLFDFDFQIECYLPAAKRRYGYFALPVLWNGRLAARMDCKAERKESLLHVNHLALEPWLKKTDAFLKALEKEMKSFMRFNNCERIHVHRTAPASVKSGLRV